MRLRLQTNKQKEKWKPKFVLLAGIEGTTVHTHFKVADKAEQETRQSLREDPEKNLALRTHGVQIPKEQELQVSQLPATASCKRTKRVGREQLGIKMGFSEEDMEPEPEVLDSPRGRAW